MLRRFSWCSATIASAMACSSCTVAGTVDVIPNRFPVEVNKVTLNGAMFPGAGLDCPVNPIASSCGNGRYVCETDATTRCQTCACTP